uniref:Ig-like domain-containing protein n=1 Tax=Amphiprion percula TaxID=161767 RepID=A0A3P8TXJ1_AMPPE
MLFHIFLDNLGQVPTLTADLGQNVTMPCQFFGNKHNNITLLKWSRPDQGPDSYILLYEDGRFHPDKQLPSYKDRVYLEDMETRDFSLILMNVTMEDRGPYECDFVEEGWNQLSRTTSTTFLEVVEPGEFVFRVQFVSLMKLLGLRSDVCGL